MSVSPVWTFLSNITEVIVFLEYTYYIILNYIYTVCRHIYIYIMLLNVIITSPAIRPFVIANHPQEKCFIEVSVGL